MEGIRPSPSAAQARPPQRHSPVWRLNRMLATPIAVVSMAIGFSPSIQSLTLTVLGVARLADGKWSHLLQGTALVYLALLFDRAENLIVEKKGKPSVWSQFLGVAVDRLVEVCLYIGLALVEVFAINDTPRFLVPWAPLPPDWVFVLTTFGAGMYMVTRVMESSAQTLLLRAHLLATRRLPGPSFIPRSRPVRPVIGRFLARDELILVWCLGLALGQLQATLMLMVAYHVLVVFETTALFRLRLRDPEGEASRVLGPEFPE